MPQFGDLPELLQLIEPDLVTLSYDHSQRLFYIGGRAHELDSPELSDALWHPHGEKLHGEQVLEEAVLLDVFAHPITTPRLFSWLKKHGGRQVFQETSDVMREVFAHIKNIRLNDKHQKEMHPFGFSCEFIREGHVVLTVLGSCACLGSNPDGHTVDSRDWETGFSELDFHNIDMPEQHISLLAGLGHLATQCLSET